MTGGHWPCAMRAGHISNSAVVVMSFFSSQLLEQVEASTEKAANWSDVKLPEICSAPPHPTSLGAKMPTKEGVLAISTSSPVPVRDGKLMSGKLGLP